ncbi:unnamed protein product [Chrysoparadoxa australica]
MSLASPWQIHLDPDNQIPFYYNAKTGATRWDHPGKQQQGKKVALSGPDEEEAIIAPAAGRINQISPHRTKKNYAQMAADYTVLRQYMLGSGTKECVMCCRRQSSRVLFPCGHKCLCSCCCRAEDWDVCPLCCQEVSQILPCTGNEEEQYWEWVMAVKPPLPDGFRQRFALASLRLQLATGNPPWAAKYSQGGCCSIQ